jgi:glutamate:GABA antiporter
VIATYAIGKGETGLGTSWPYVLSVSLAALWIATLLNVVGVGTGKWLQNVGGIATYIPGVLLVALGVIAIATHPPANAFSLRALVPDVRDLSTLNLWGSIAFAFAGLELSSTMGDEVRNASRSLPRSIYISAPLIAGAYILGTVAILWLIPTGSINIVSGFIQGIDVGGRALSPALVWLAPAAAALYTVSNVGGVGAWLSGPARVAFAIGLDRYFPAAFARVHPRWGTPYVAIVVQALLATLFLLFSVLGKGSTVERVYLILLDTQILIYFIPYLYLFAILLRQRPRTAGRTLAAISGLGVTAFAMIVAATPPADAAAAFELKVLGGAAGFIGLGLVVYWRGRGRR